MPRSIERTKAALREHDSLEWDHRAIEDVREYARRHADEIQAEWDAHSALANPRKQAAEHLAAMSAERWQQLNAEWEDEL